MLTEMTAMASRISLLFLTTVLLGGTTRNLHSAAAEASTRESTFSGAGLDDKTFDESVTLFEYDGSAGLSGLTCALACERREACWSFTHHRDGDCRGYSVSVTEATAATPAPGTKAFVKTNTSQSAVGHINPCNNAPPSPNDVTAAMVDGVCYYGYQTSSPSDWDDAASLCEGSGMHMFHLQTAAKQQAVFDALSLGGACTGLQSLKDTWRWRYNSSYSVIATADVDGRWLFPASAATAAVEFRGCEDVRLTSNLSGPATVRPHYADPSDPSDLLDVYCDQENDGGGWTVFQRRLDGSVDFFRNWADYQTGFGDLTGEFWLGLETLHRMTSLRSYDLRLDLTNFSNLTGYATYSNFTISDSTDSYRLNFNIYTGGNTSDCLTDQRGWQFSTPGIDNDGMPNLDCADYKQGAWWFGNCGTSSLNGLYKTSGVDIENNGVQWWGEPLGMFMSSLKHAEMKIRPSQ